MQKVECMRALGRQLQSVFGEGNGVLSLIYREAREATRRRLKVGMAAVRRHEITTGNKRQGIGLRIVPHLPVHSWVEVRVGWVPFKGLMRPCLESTSSLSAFAAR